jgi:hypothetical protein
MWSQQTYRVRIEREYDRRSGNILRSLKQAPHDFDVAAMHAIEIANRHRTATRRSRQCIKMTNNVHVEQRAGSKELGVGNGNFAACGLAM